MKSLDVSKNNVLLSLLCLDQSSVVCSYVGGCCLHSQGFVNQLSILLAPLFGFVYGSKTIFELSLQPELLSMAHFENFSCFCGFLLVEILFLDCSLVEHVALLDSVNQVFVYFTAALDLALEVSY